MADTFLKLPIPISVKTSALLVFATVHHRLGPSLVFHRQQPWWWGWSWSSPLLPRFLPLRGRWGWGEPLPSTTFSENVFKFALLWIRARGDETRINPFNSHLLYCGFDFVSSSVKSLNCVQTYFQTGLNWNPTQYKSCWTAECTWGQLLTDDNERIRQNTVWYCIMHQFQYKHIQKHILNMKKVGIRDGQTRRHCRRVCAIFIPLLCLFVAVCTHRVATNRLRYF